MVRFDGRNLAVVLWLMVGATLLGCSSERDPTSADVNPAYAAACVPGRVEACACSAGVVGTSACSTSGASLGPCQCPEPNVAVTARLTPPATSSPASMAAKPTGENTTPARETLQPEVESPPAVDLRARHIRIREVAIYQAVKVPLVKDGEAVVERNAPVVVGKEAFVRVFVEPLQGFTPRKLEAELTLRSAESAVESVIVQQDIAEASRENSLNSTINFDVPASSVTGDLRWAVTLRELEPNAVVGPVDDDARFPQQEDVLEKLVPRDAGPLRVMIVPYKYNADGSGRMPDMSDEQIERYRSYLYAYYPVTEVLFEIHEPVEYSRSLGPSTGWESWLDSHCALRTSEKPDPKLLYFGVIAPTASAREYRGGTAGISYLPGPAANFGRCSVGLGFTGEQSAFVMTHELGHSLGLPHAPCGVSGGPYPYAEGKIGSWGFGLDSRTLKAPQEHYDLMSYCNPTFISDYNYQRVFERVRYLNLQFARIGNTDGPERYLRVLQRSDGTREVVGLNRFDEAPGGSEELRDVRLFDEQGAQIESSRASYFIPMAEEGAGSWFIPDVGAHSVAFESNERMDL